MNCTIGKLLSHYLQRSHNIVKKITLTFNSKLIQGESLVFFKKMGQTLSLFCLFSFFSLGKYSTNLTIIIKAKMECLGLKTGAERWQAQTNPRSYGDTHKSLVWAHVLFTKTNNFLLKVVVNATALGGRPCLRIVTFFKPKNIWRSFFGFVTLHYCLVSWNIGIVFLQI